MFEGNFGDKRDLFSEYKNKIISERPSKSDTIERYLLLASDLNGIEINSTLKPSETTLGASILIVEAIEKKVSGGGTFDNRGTESSGPIQLSTTLSLANPFGFFSKTSLLYATAEQVEELQYILLEHNQILNSEGTEAYFKLSSSKTMAGRGILNELDHESTGQYSELGITHPFIRSRAMNLSLGASFGARDQDTLLLNESVSLDRTRVLRLNSTFDYADKFGGVSLILLNFSHGFDAFGATPDSSTIKTRSEGDA